MFKTKMLAAILLIAAVLFAGCKKKEAAGPGGGDSQCDPSRTRHRREPHGARARSKSASNGTAGPRGVANKVSILRRFLGADRVEKAGGPVKTKRRRLGNGGGSRSRALLHRHPSG